MFLLLKGKSKDEAFKIGQEIADTVTKMFPKPVKLKFEKVRKDQIRQGKIRQVFNPIALRKAKIVYNFGLSECNRVNIVFSVSFSVL